MPYLEFLVSSGIHVKIVNYPESDGKPMGETDEHRTEMTRQIDLLQHFYENQQVYVSGNLLMYYEQGNPRKFVVPDVFVVKGISPSPRRIYRIWLERKVPNVVIETTSRKTRKKDLHEKPELYARLGIPEYFLFDCLQEYLDSPLLGYRLVDGAYQSIAAEATGVLASQELGLRLNHEAGKLQFHRLDDGQRLLTSSERAQQQSERAQQESKRAQHETERADREASARRLAELELERLRAELARRDQR